MLKLSVSFLSASVILFSTREYPTCILHYRVANEFVDIRLCLPISGMLLISSLTETLWVLPFYLFGNKGGCSDCESNLIAVVQ